MHKDEETVSCDVAATYLRPDFPSLSWLNLFFEDCIWSSNFCILSPSTYIVTSESIYRGKGAANTHPHAPSKLNLCF